MILFLFIMGMVPTTKIVCRCLWTWAQCASQPVPWALRTAIRAEKHIISNAVRMQCEKHMPSIFLNPSVR
jgi:hypothetical protein